MLVHMKDRTITLIVVTSGFLLTLAFSTWHEGVFESRAADAVEQPAARPRESLNDSMAMIPFAGPMKLAAITQSAAPQTPTSSQIPAPPQTPSASGAPFAPAVPEAPTPDAGQIPPSTIPEDPPSPENGSAADNTGIADNAAAEPPSPEDREPRRGNRQH
jgi:hypothetical protein